MKNRLRGQRYAMLTKKKKKQIIVKIFCTLLTFTGVFLLFIVHCSNGGYERVGVC